MKRPTAAPLALEVLGRHGLTAYAHAEDRRRALDAGFQAHLRKPFDQNELFTVIGNLAKLSPTRQSA